MPVHWKTVRLACKLKTVRAPLFPRYMFLALDNSRDYSSAINGTFSFCGFVMVDGKPQPVPFTIVERFFALTDNKVIIRFDLELAVDLRCGFSKDRSWSLSASLSSLTMQDVRAFC